MFKFAGHNKLQRKIGFFPLVGLGVGATIGAGIFSTISEVAAVSDSSLMLVLAFLIGALFQIPCCFCYAELTSAYPEDGGHYVYFREAGFKLLTFLIGWLTFFIIDAPAIGVMGLAISNYLSVFFDVNINVLKLFPAFIVAFFAYLNVKSVKLGGVIQAILTFIKVLPFIFIIGWGVFQINPDLFLSNTSSSSINTSDLAVSGNWVVMMLTSVSMSMFSFDGLFAGCYVSGEIKNPKKTLPKALVATTLIVLFLYVSLTSVSSGVMSIDELASSSAPIADVASKFLGIGQYAGPIMAVVAILVIIGAISSCLLYMPRLEYAMAKDGLFFPAFALVHKKYNTPYVSIILFALMTIIFMFLNDLTTLLTSFTILLITKNMLTYATIFILRRKDNYKPTYKSPGGLIMPVIATASMLIMLIAVIASIDIYSFIPNIFLILAGVIAYFIFKKFVKNSY